MSTRRLTSGLVTFTVENDLVVADPCYIDSDDFTAGRKPTVAQVRKTLGHMGVIVADCEGTWDAESVTENGGIGEVVGRLELTRRGTRVTGSRVFAGTNGVDSGTMFAGPRESLPIDYEHYLQAHYDGNGDWLSFDHIAYGREGGIACSTGYGDGAYPVHVAQGSDGRPAQIIVDFLPDEEECENCGYPEDVCECCINCSQSPDFCRCDVDCIYCGEYDHDPDDCPENPDYIG